MDGVDVVWVWDAASGRYLRHQDGRPHVAPRRHADRGHERGDLYVAYLPSPADVRSPEAQTLGTGQLVVHRNGVAMAGT